MEAGRRTGVLSAVPSFFTPFSAAGSLAAERGTPYLSWFSPQIREQERSDPLERPKPCLY